MKFNIFVLLVALILSVEGLRQNHGHYDSGHDDECPKGGKIYSDGLSKKA